MVERFEKLTSCDLESLGWEYNSMGTGVRKIIGFGRFAKSIDAYNSKGCSYCKCVES